MRINLLISDDLGSKIDKRAKELGITRTALISSYVTRQLEQDEMIKAFPSLMLQANELQLQGKASNVPYKDKKNKG